MVKRFSGDLPYGVMTSAMPFLNLKQSVKLIANIGGVQEVELSAVDAGGARMADKNDHAGAHLPTYEFAAKPKDTAKRFADLFNEHELGVTIGNYDRIHSSAGSADRKSLDYMLKVIDFASALGGRDGGAYGVNVGMFWGWNRYEGIEDNLNDVASKVYVLAKYAQDRNVTITTENCHMPGGWPAKDELDLPQHVMRSAGSTLAGRIYVTDKLLNWGIKPKTLGHTWDPSHPETEHNEPHTEAQESFKRERNIMLHVKGHNPNVEGEALRRAYFGGPAMPGWFAPKDSEFYETMKRLGVPIADNAWAQQYGRVTLPGVGRYNVTPIGEIINIARENGFNGRVIAENETPEKGLAVANKDKKAIAQMYADCRDVIKDSLWSGESYAGREFKPLNVRKNGLFEQPMNWEQAVDHYGWNS